VPLPERVSAMRKVDSVTSAPALLADADIFTLTAEGTAHGAARPAMSCCCGETTASCAACSRRRWRAPPRADSPRACAQTSPACG
jgi:hypothetical protein